MQTTQTAVCETSQAAVSKLPFEWVYYSAVAVPNTPLKNPLPTPHSTPPQDANKNTIISGVRAKKKERPNSVSVRPHTPLHFSAIFSKRVT